MIYLSEEEVLKIHKKIVDHTGGSHGVRDMGLLSSAVNTPKSSFGGEELHKGVFEKAASLFFSLARNHPFIDGNKRTSITATSRFLYLNGYSLKTSKKEFVSFTLKVAEGKAEIKKIAKWLKKNTKKK